MKIIRIIGIIILILILLTPAFLFLGNPVSYVLTFASTGICILFEHPELDVQLDRIVYDFKFGGYNAYYSSPSSIDTHFIFVCDGLGRIRYNSIECIYDGTNTFDRIQTNYQSACDAALDAEFSFELNFGYSQITVEHGNEVSSINKDFGILMADIENLELDGDYDFRVYAAKHGRIYLSVFDPQVTPQRAAQILLEVKEHFDRENIPFYAVELMLNTNGVSEDYVWLVDFLYQDIYEEGLADRVAVSNNLTHDHYEEKEAEIS